MALSLASASLLVIFLTSFLLYTMLNLQVHHRTQAATVSFVIGRSYNTPAELAHGGQLLSFDPTGQHLVYTPINQPGVMYTSDLDNAIATNLLAMRYARDIAWSPDGTNLVTTINPIGTLEPLLALVPTGKYMHLLGHEAVASGWSPLASQGITYITQTRGLAELWQTNVNGNPAKLLATMPLSSTVQHLAWSSDGRTLALVVTLGKTISRASLQEPARAIYVMDSRTNSLHELIAPGSFTIGKISWSPNGKDLAYERVDMGGHVTIQGIEAATGRTLFAFTIHGQAMGWSWSPDSRVLVYSDGGDLHAYTLQGPTFAFPTTMAIQAYPFWLSNGGIVFLQISSGIGQLTSLDQSSKR